jgi:hypothetical protein
LDGHRRGAEASVVTRAKEKRGVKNREKMHLFNKTHVGVLQSNDQLAAQLGFSSADDAVWTCSAAEGMRAG